MVVGLAQEIGHKDVESGEVIAVIVGAGVEAEGLKARKEHEKLAQVAHRPDEKGDDEESHQRRAKGHDQLQVVQYMQVECFSRVSHFSQQIATSGVEPSKILIFTIFASVIAILLVIGSTIPPLSSIDGGDKFIWKPSSAKEFEFDKSLLIKYRDVHSFRLLIGMGVLYILCQTFCVPGSGTSMNVLGGLIWSEYVDYGEYLIALPFCLTCISTGATMCYLLSFLTARELVTRSFPEKVQWLRKKIGESTQKAWSAILLLTSLRMSPVVPAYFLNIAAPLTPVPIWQFWVSSILGSTPHAILTVKAGATISHLKPGESVLEHNKGNFLFLLVFAFGLIAIPLYLNRRSKAEAAAGSTKEFAGKSGMHPMDSKV